MPPKRPSFSDSPANSSLSSKPRRPSIHPSPTPSSLSQRPQPPPALKTPQLAGGMAQHPKVVSFRHSSSDAPYEEYSSNENTPLIRPRTTGDIDSLYKTASPLDSEDWNNQGGDGDDDEDADEETKSSLFLFLLTLGGLGLQIGWSVETSNGSVSMSYCCRAISNHHSPISFLSVLASPCSRSYG
jgi:solute carrier family 45 protein 1/2/4